MSAQEDRERRVQRLKRKNSHHTSHRHTQPDHKPRLEPHTPAERAVVKKLKGIIL